MPWARCSDTSRPILSREADAHCFSMTNRTAQATADLLPSVYRSRFGGSEPIDRCLARSYGDRRRQQHVSAVGVSAIYFWNPYRRWANCEDRSGPFLPTASCPFTTLSTSPVRCPTES